MSSSRSHESDDNRILKVLSLNVWGLAFISKKQPERIRAIAEYLASSTYDVVCLQEIWIYKDFELVRDEVLQNLPFSRFFHTGALGSGLAIFTRFPVISAEAFPYSLSGVPYHPIDGDFFVNKAAGNVVILHPRLGEVEIWNTHMHAAGEHPPDTRQAHRIAQSWQLANAIRSGAAKGRYILAMGDFNSQPSSIPIQILRSHAHVSDSFNDTHPHSDSLSSVSPDQGLKEAGMTCDSPLNTWSHGKPIPAEVTNRGGKRLDYIFYRQPAIARKRPLIWGQRHGGSDHNQSTTSEGDELEEGNPIQDSVDEAPRLRCQSSEVVLTGQVPGQTYSYSDHFGLFSTFVVDQPGYGPSRSSEQQQAPSSRSSRDTNTNSFEPLLSKHTTNPSISSIVSPTTPYAQPASAPDTLLGPSATKSQTIQSALHVLSLYTRISQTTAKTQLRLCIASIVALIALTVGSAFQPKSWLQPIFTLLGGALGAGGATMLYMGFVWGRWEMGLLTEVQEEMELELRVVGMEQQHTSRY